MAVKETQRVEATEAIADHLLKEGLARTGVRRLAAAAGISDRMLLYYFKNKDEVMLAALSALAGRLTGQLDAAIPVGAGLLPGDMFDQAAALIDQPDVRPFLNLWIEATAFAVRRISPYPMIAGALAQGFLTWMEQRLADRSGSTPADDASMLMGMIDGLEIVRICAGEAAYKAAREGMARALPRK